MIDTHAHITDKSFDADRPDAIRRACDAGVEAVVEICDDAARWASSLGFVSGHAGVFASIGFHPHNAKDYFEKGNDVEFERLACGDQEACRIVAVGEVGLDYYRNNSPPEIQRKAFSKQLDIWRRSSKPLIVHSRDAANDTAAMLREHVPNNIKNAGIIHCFTLDAEAAFRYIELGFLIGIGGAVTFPGSSVLRDAVKEIGLDNIVIETDCPYLAPVPCRGRRNEPAYIVHTAQKIAEIFNKDMKLITEATSANARNIFKIEKDEKNHICDNR